VLAGAGAGASAQRTVVNCGWLMSRQRAVTGGHTV
jgi:hypothetical protein